MTNNVGTPDRIARSLLAVTFLGLIGTGTVTGPLAWVLGALSLVLLLTSAVRYCPLYAALGISTRSRQSTNA